MILPTSFDALKIMLNGIGWGLNDSSEPPYCNCNQQRNSEENDPNIVDSTSSDWVDVDEKNDLEERKSHYADNIYAANFAASLNAQQLNSIKQISQCCCEMENLHKNHKK